MLNICSSFRSCLFSESNLSRCGFRGSSHIGIPYSTKVQPSHTPACFLRLCFVKTKASPSFALVLEAASLLLSLFSVVFYIYGNPAPNILLFFPPAERLVVRTITILSTISSRIASVVKIISPADVFSRAQVCSIHMTVAM